MSDATPRRNRQPEHRLQTWVDRLIDRVVLPPMFTTGIDHASQTTDNARARMAERGIKFGVPDVYVCQDHPPRHLWIELKVGKNTPTDPQKAVHKQMRGAGELVEVAWTVPGVFICLHDAGFRLHGNARNIAAEIDARHRAAEAAPRKAPRKARAQKPRVSAGKVARWRRAGVLV